jgi:hypothetical protein
MNESLFDLRTIYNEGKTMEFTEDYIKQVIKEELTKIVKEGEIVDLYPDPFPEIPDSEISRQDKRKLAALALDWDLESEVDNLEWDISNILNNRGEILSKPELYNWLKEIHSFENPQAFDIAIHNLLMSSEIFYNKKTKEYFGKQFADSFPSEKILPLSYYRKKTNPYNEGKTMEFTKTELTRLIEEVIEESHTKADEENLKKISKQLKKSVKMHGDQSDAIDDIVDRSGDEELDEKINRMIREEYKALMMEEKSAKDKMKCNSPRRIRKGEPGHGKKKFVVKACDGGTEKIIRYGDAGLKIKRKQAGRRKNFRARHNCDSPGSKLKARYWSCKNW